MLPPGGLAHVRGRLAIATTEGTIEIGKVAKSACKCDCRDFPLLLPRIAQKLGSMFEAFVQNVFREAPPRLFKQQAQIAGVMPSWLAMAVALKFGSRMPCSMLRKSQRAAPPYAALLHKLTRVAFGPERQRDEVDEMLAEKLRCTSAVLQADIERTARYPNSSRRATSSRFN